MLVVVESTETPVIPLDIVKEYLNEIGTDKDTEITSMINAVVEDAENLTSRRLSVTTYELYTNHIYDGFKLPKNPINSIDKIEYMDENEVYQVLDSSLYYLYEKFGIGTIKLKEKIVSIDHEKAIKITFNCGYKNIPEPIVTWAKYKVMCLFDAKEENINKFVDEMINKFRIRSI